MLWTRVSIALIAMLAASISAGAAELRTKVATPDHMECKASGGKTCKIDAALNADKGFVICTILGTGSGGRYITYWKTMSNQLPNDEQKYRRYLTAKWHGEADSGHPPAENWGSSVSWTHMGITEIGINATVKQRWDAGCSMQPNVATFEGDAAAR